MAYIKVVIIGGGFGGLNAALALKKAKADVLVIDKTNHHLFQPLLYQVATAALSSANIAQPIREVLRHQDNTSVIMANIVNIDKAKKTVIAENGEVFPYDYLIVATGASHSYFGHQEWEKIAPGLKTLEDAVTIRERVLFAFEQAERSNSFAEAEKFLRFIIIGGGPTGVEMAGAIAEIARNTLFKNFRKIKPEQAHIYLIEGLDHILPSYPERLSEKAKDALENLGVCVMTGVMVTEVSSDGVMLCGHNMETKDARFLESKTIIWAAGNAASPLLQVLDTPLDRQGRAIVEPDLSILQYPNIFVIGDAALAKDKEGKPLPGVAQAAIQEARYVAKVIAKNIPSSQRKPFVYVDKGSMATIGKAKAVAYFGKVQISGLIAWLAWGFVHILFLISFRNRIIVMTQWMFWYFTGKRNVRIITRPIEEIEK